MNKFHVLSVVLFLVMFIPLSLQAYDALQAANNGLENTLQIVTQAGEKFEYEIDLAITEKEQSQGLMYRNEIAENYGMLFVYPRNSEQRFWMKNTLIPLDMIFIKDDGVIHRIEENTKPLDLTPIASQGRIKAVFEIRGGQSSERGIKAGDKVSHSLFSNLLEE